MNLTDKKSKVALCMNCKGYVLAGHIDYITKNRESEFTQLTNEGYEVKIETLQETRDRGFVFSSLLNNGKCEDCNAQT
jgi:hypothetical protein